MKKRALPLSRVYQLLEPGPVVLLTTSARGRANVMPMSWHVMLEFEPPLVGCVVSDRALGFEALAATGEARRREAGRAPHGLVAPAAARVQAASTGAEASRGIST